MKKSVLISIIIYAIVSFLVKPVEVKAEGEVGFNIQMIPSDYQQTIKSSYFDLRLKPGQKETIYVLINNTSDKEMTYDLSINQGYTNEQGFIDYQEKKLAEDNDYPVSIDEIVMYDKSVIVPAQQGKKVPIRISLPMKKFDGQILAGIKVTIQSDDSKLDTQINNSYGYILGLKITETDDEVSREVILKAIYSEFKFGQPVVIVQLKNPTMDAIGHLIYDAKIVTQKTGEVFYQKTYDSQMELSPNSNYDFAIEFEDKKLLPGDYLLDLTVSDAKQHTWHFREDFKISSSEASTINQATIDQGKESNNHFMVLIILSIMISVLFLFSLYVCLRYQKRKG